MRKVPALLVHSVTLLVLALAITTTGCGSEEAASTTHATTTPTATATPTTTVAEEEPGFVVERDLVFATCNDFTSASGPHDLTLDLYIPADPIGAPIVIDAPFPEDLAQAGAMVVVLKDCVGDPPDAEDEGVRCLRYNGAHIRAQAEMCACAIRFARARASELGNDDPRVVLVGCSQGAGMMAHVALFGATLEERWDEFAAAGGPTCQVEGVVAEDSTRVDALVSTAGSYDLYVPAIEGFYGRTYQQSFDPVLQEFLASAVGANPQLVVRLFHGTRDPAIPVTVSTDFEAALAAAGYDVQLTTFEGGHSFAPKDIGLGVLMEVLGL